jgi:hypothetical protein
MGLRRLQVAPRFQNDELVFEVDALENIVALIAGFFAACSSHLHEETRGVTLGGRHVRHYVSRTSPPPHPPRLDSIRPGRHYSFGMALIILSHTCWSRARSGAA